MIDVSARLLSLLTDGVASHPTILELGCGTGALSVALVSAGAPRLLGVDLSPASIDVARRRAAAAGLDDVARFSVGNAAADPLGRHDWVILDRSICCFGDAPRLVRAAIGAAGRRIAISLPESRGWRGMLNRMLWGAQNLWDRVSGGCPGYVHDLRRIETQLARAGFRPASRRATHIGLWYVGVYDR